MWELPEAPDVMISLGTLLAGAAAVWGAITAHRGLSTWKTQQHGSADFDLARRLLVTMYKKKDALNSLRNPIFFADEMEFEREFELTKQQLEKQKSSAAFQRRWEKVFDCNAELYPTLLEAEAIWGKDISKLHDELHSLESKLRVAIEMHIEESGNTRPPFQNFETREQYLENYNTVFRRSDDQFGADYQSKFSALENYLKQKIGRKL